MTSGEAGGDAGGETRVLPALAAGEAAAPFTIASWSEDFARDTTWNEHSHPFHELLWNERGASTAVVGARVWTITPALGLWMPAGTLHSGTRPRAPGAAPGSSVTAAWPRCRPRRSAWRSPRCSGCCWSGSRCPTCPPGPGR
ncbi:AraC family ligand binding domain-containing protein [Actinomadura sp. CNU-125]|uniref:AraC family ligand binding domain-containing protein n=1 Tax=Actinomadura sp. CNU-125 TaxID=1904961 RepID=UPI00291688C6|nr:AraC family ligand binding domain-containing protein [Actinomadura sp. CNU-125]